MISDPRHRAALVQRRQVSMIPSRLRISLLAIIVAAPLVFLIWSQANGALYRGLQPGDHLPLAELRSLSGETVSTGSWYGGPTLLVLFQPGCQACLGEIATLAKLAPTLHRVRIVLLSVKSDADPDAPFPIYIDPGGTFLKKTRKLLVPTTYWIDADGCILYARVGRAGEAEQSAVFRDLLSRGRNGRRF